MQLVGEIACVGKDGNGNKLIINSNTVRMCYEQIDIFDTYKHRPKHSIAPDAIAQRWTI